MRYASCPWASCCLPHLAKRSVWGTKNLAAISWWLWLRRLDAFWLDILPAVRLIFRTSRRGDCVHAGLARGTCLLSAGQARTAIGDFLPVRQTKECSPTLAVAVINPAFSVQEAWTFGSVARICSTDDGLGTYGVLRSRTESSEKRYREEHDGLHYTLVPKPNSVKSS